MRKNSTKKLSVKNVPRFLTLSVLSLVLIIIILMSLFFLMTKIAAAFHSQAQILQTSNSFETNAPKSEPTNNPTNENAKANPPPQVSNADPFAEIKSRLRSGDTDGIKVVFLTFDDGPSDDTGELLDILADYDIKGTFFTTHHDNDYAKNMYRRIVDEGHTLANHTSSHDYSLYDTPEAFFSDVDALDQFQKEITDQNNTSHIFRFPGGSMNSNEACIQGILDRGYNYSDWNVSSGDGCADPLPSNMIAQKIIESCRQHDVSVVLSHAELKSSSREAMSIVIETLLEEGYTFLNMEADYTYPRHLEL